MPKEEKKPPAELIIKQKIQNLGEQLEAVKRESLAARRKYEEMEITGQKIIGAIAGLQELLKDFV